MLIATHTEETQASKEAIWEVWKRVEEWHTWDHGIEYSQIDGPFAVGTKGTLKPKGGPLVQTHLTQVEPLKKFVDESTLFLAKIIVSHELKELENKRLITHQIEMVGPLAFFFAYMIGRKMKVNLPAEMKAMVKRAIQLEGSS